MRNDGSIMRTEFRQASWRRRYAQTNDKEVYQDDPELDAIQKARQLEVDDPAAAFLQLRTLAEHGSVWSMMLAGWAYQTGKGITADQDQAEYWYRLASEHGCQQAQLRLGRIYLERWEFEQCQDLFEVGVREGWAPALYYSACVKLRQPETAERSLEARILLEKAAIQGDREAQLELATLMARGRFGQRLRPRGFYLLLSAAREVVADINKNGAIATSA